MSLQEPIVLLIPILMILDYYLTLVGASLYDKAYARHFTSNMYEINPIWQQAIAQKRWFNLRFFMNLILISGFMIALNLTIPLIPSWQIREFLTTANGFYLGALIIPWATIIGRHICNILIFYSTIKNPIAFEGKISIDQEMNIKSSAFHFFATLLPLITIAFINPSTFLFGGIFGVLSIMLQHWFWVRKYRKNISKSIG